MLLIYTCRLALLGSFMNCPDLEVSVDEAPLLRLIKEKESFELQ